MRVWDVATGIPWAITEDALRTILEIASRSTTLDAEAIERIERMQAVQAVVGEPLVGTDRVTVRDGIAVVPVVGPLFRRANLFTRISGATSTELLARDFKAALDSPQVRGIMFAVDSPGGEASGISELSDLIYEARGQKPIVAHISGAGASGAYWIASSAEEVVTADTGIVGSIGVVLRVLDTRKAGEKTGVEEIEFVSSQTPKKSPDPKKADGRAQIQRMVDDMAAVFLSAVARNRGIDVDGAAEQFGEGDVFVGQAAVDRGLADRVATFEETFAALRDRTERRSFPASGGFTSDLEESMSEKTTPAPAAEQKPADQGAAASAPMAPDITAAYVREHHPDVSAELRAEGAKAERERIAKIEALALPGHEQLVAKAKADGMSPEEFAAAQIQAEKERRQARFTALKQDEADLDAPAAGAHNDTDPNSDEAIAARILSAGRVERLARKEA